MLNNIKESGFIEIYKRWTNYGYGSMLVYIEPPKKETHSYKCEYVLFREEDSPYKVVINQDLLDLYNRGN